MLKINILFSVIIIIVILLLYFYYENFDFANNNLIDNINENKLKLSNIDVSGNINLNNTNIMDIIYPVGSLWFSEKQYNLSNKTSLLGTPLYFGEWSIVNQNSNENNFMVFGLTKLNDNSGIKGSNKLDITNIPPHSHQIWNSSTAPLDWNNKSQTALNLNRGKGNIDTVNTFGSEQITKNMILKLNTSDNNSAEVISITDNDVKQFIPKGYYVYCYKRTK